MAERAPDTLARAGARTRTLPYVLLVASMLFWAGNWVIGRGVHETMPPVGLNFWRWVVAVLVMTPFAVPAMRGKWKIVRQEWRLLSMLGLTGVVLFQTLVYVGLRYTTAINGMLLNSTAPLSIIIVSWLMLREGVTGRQWLGVAISFAGVFVIVTRGDLSQLLALRFNIGDLVIFLAMPLWAVYSALLRRKPAELSDVALLWLIGVFSLGPLSLAYLGENLMGRHVRFDLQSLAIFLYIGTVASVLAILFWNKAVAKVGPNIAGFFIHLLPAFGTVLAVVFLGESVFLFQLAGVSLIFVGIYFSTSARARRKNEAAG